MEHLLSMREPSTVNTWRPTESQRVVYASLLQKLLDGYDELKSFEKYHVLKEGEIQKYVSASSLDYFRNQIEPRISDLKTAYKRIDPDGSELYELLDGLGAPSGGGSRVLATFEVGLRQVYDLIDRNPDQDYRLLPDTAAE